MNARGIFPSRSTIDNHCVRGCEKTHTQIYDKKATRIRGGAQANAQQLKREMVIASLLPKSPRSNIRSIVISTTVYGSITVGSLYGECVR